MSDNVHYVARMPGYVKAYDCSVIYKCKAIGHKNDIHHNRFFEIVRFRGGSLDGEAVVMRASRHKRGKNRVKVPEN